MSVDPVPVPLATDLVVNERVYPVLTDGTGFLFGYTHAQPVVQTQPEFSVLMEVETQHWGGGDIQSVPSMREGHGYSQGFGAGVG